MLDRINIRKESLRDSGGSKVTRSSLLAVLLVSMVIGSGSGSLSAPAFAAPSVSSERDGSGGGNARGPEATDGGKCEGVKDWFRRYDSIRHEAQMTPSERILSSRLVKKGLLIVVLGIGKHAARKLLEKMVHRYDKAESDMKTLARLPETAELHDGYVRYFRTARGLFEDDLMLLEDVSAKDTNGEPIRKNLKQRKQELEELERSLKELDRDLRQKFGVSPYRYHYL